MAHEKHFEHEIVDEDLRGRIELGADEDLLALFGRTPDSENRTSVDNIRRHVLSKNYLTEDKIGDTSNPALLAISDHGETLYPAFQFEPGTAELRPQAAVINHVLKTLTPDGLRPWEIATWWVAGNGYLDGDSPVNVMLQNDSDHLLADALYAEIYP